MKRFLTNLFVRSAKSLAVRPSLTERHRTLLQIESLEERQMLSTATFLKMDTTTQGNWIGVYGKEGYNVVGDTAKPPSYANVTAKNGGGEDETGTFATFSSDPTSSDQRALQRAKGSDRVADKWFNYDYQDLLTIDVNMKDSQTHQLALYVLDFDNKTRSERLDVVDPASGATLDSQTASSFTGGEYLVWNISGPVQIKVTRLMGYDAVVCGVFFDAANQRDSTALTAPTNVQWTPASGNDGTLSWSKVAGADGYHIDWSSDDNQWFSLKNDATGAVVDIPADQTSTTISRGAGYYFSVSAYNKATGGELWSAAILASASNQNPSTAPAAPTGLTWTATSGNDGALSWSSVAGANGYDIYYYDSSSSQWVFLSRVDANQTSLSITNGAGYYFSVGAFNDAGETFSDPFLAG